MPYIFCCIILDTASENTLVPVIGKQANSQRRKIFVPSVIFDECTNFIYISMGKWFLN